MTTPNPANPADPRAAAEMIRDLAGSPDFDAVAMVNRLAPILARAYLDSNPPLVWRALDAKEVCALEYRCFYQILFCEKVLLEEGEAIKGWHNSSMNAQIAAHAETLLPWPVTLAEVGE